MSDYYSPRDPARTSQKAGYPDYSYAGSTSTWLWVGIVLVAIVALIALGVSGGSDNGQVTTDGVVAPEATLAVPDATVTETVPAPIE